MILKKKESHYLMERAIAKFYLYSRKYYLSKCLHLCFTCTKLWMMNVVQVLKGIFFNLFPCACTCRTRGEFAYTLEGLLIEEFMEACISVNVDSPKHQDFYCQACQL